MKDKYIKVKKPVVSDAVAVFIESTKDDDILDIKFEVELYYPEENEKLNSTPGKEIADYINNCFEEFVIARKYGYIIK